MLREDTLGGYVGEFAFRGSTIAYNVEGSGSPVPIARGLSTERGSYDLCYIFDCLAGTSLVYALDVTGPGGLPAATIRYAGLRPAGRRAITAIQPGSAGPEGRPEDIFATVLRTGHAVPGIIPALCAACF
jgi:hypothetical protein